MRSNVQAAPQPRRRRRRVIFVGLIIAILLFGTGSARFYTDLLWFDEVGFQSVLWTSLRAQFLLGLIVGVIVASLIFVNLALALKSRPAYAFARLENVTRIDPMERYRDQLMPYTKWIRLAVAVGIGLLAGLSASSGWRTFLLWINGTEFGTTDPQFGLDVGFYVFELPFFNFALSWLWFSLMITLVVSVAGYYLLGAIRPEGGLSGLESGALAHISVLLGFLALVKAAQYWLGRYSLNFSERGVVTGASYTDVHAHLPALSLLAIISVISAGLFLVNIRFRRLSLPLAAVAIWIFFSIVAGGAWPFVVQRFSVEPQELQREQPYIERNIRATRQAFGLAEVAVESFAAAETLPADSVEKNQSLLQNVRLWDPLVLEQVYSQLQAIRTYYQFADVDIDRYEVDGQLRQVLLSARELALDNLQDPTWSNEHLQFTHGFGVVASLANSATPSGLPTFLVRDVPGTVAQEAQESFDLEQPRLYYGEAFGSDEYSIVNTQQEEIDFPVGDGVQRSQYDGLGGVPTGNMLTRVAFALRESDPNFVLSSLITPESRILLYRNVRDRVERAAPFLSLDNDPYPAVVDGGLVWIIDAYTSTPFYPYSQRQSLSTIVPAGASATLSGEANYIRNSVKVVIDAYDGTMDFHVVDEGDPLIRAWRNAFPALFTDETPSEDLRAHFRFPEDLFNVQSQVYRNYHVIEPQNFYAREDAWEVPDRTDISDEVVVTGEAGPVPPTYLLIQLPGETEQEFVLTRPFTPRSKRNMIAFMAARSDPEHYGELVTLRFPSQRAVDGPVLVDNRIKQDVEISQALTLLGQQGSRVGFGSLIILPIEESILYVQPLFVTASSEAGGIPELKRVILVSGEQVVMGESFSEALTQLFGLDQPALGEPPKGGGGGQGSAELRQIVAEAGRVYQEAQQALAAGDFEGYGALIEELGELLERAESLS
ncbi:MAG: UPF0182 family membrane protein [Actinomycetota bacterium]